LPYDAQLGLLMQIPGVDWVIAATIIAEIGVDMSLFLGADHLAAWAGICPGSYEGAGKRRRSDPQGQFYLRTASVTATIAAAKPRGTYQYYHLRARRGQMRAASRKSDTKSLSPCITCSPQVPTTKTLAQAISTPFRKNRTTANLVRRLNDMGYDVALQPKAA
jgi:transposase